jgi:hypothetical protein
MYYFVTSSKDATLYLQQPSQNTGRDEILEVSKTYYGNLKDVAHTLIKFDTDTLSSKISSGEVTMSEATLLLRECESDELPLDYTIYANIVSGSWEMGIGTRFDDITSDGVSWKQRNNNVEWLDDDYATGVTGSLNGYGGTWFTGSESTQSFSYESTDISMDVSASLNEWISGTYSNEGFILRHSSVFENDTNDYGQLKFFSKETNTIYQPKIRIGWDDSSFTTGSLTELSEDDIKVTFKRLKSTYKVNSKPKVLVFGRELYPLKTYTNEFAYNDVKFLPSTTYYQVKDAITDEVIIPFSNYSKVSCDSNGNFIRLNLENWETNREYYIEIKVDRDGVVEYFSDKDLTFLVEK